jgi:membrane associated rhomboid family serine protease
MKIHYNAPVVLTFSIIAVLIFLTSAVFSERITTTFFVVRPTFSFVNVLDYFRIVSHVLGHASFQHLFGNLTLILLLGPILEEKYGSSTILTIMLVTAFATGVVNVLFFSKGLLGASSIVFAFIILASIVNMRANSIPLSFLLVSAIFIGSEVLQMFQQDDISQTAHIVGGVVGAVFGFQRTRPSGGAPAAWID